MDTASSLDDDMTLRDFCGLQDGVCAVDRRMGEAASRGGGPVGGATSAGGGGWVPGGGLTGSGPGRAGKAAPRPGGGGRAAGKAGSGGRGRKHSRQDAGMDVSAPAGRRRRYVPAQVTPSVPLPFPAYGQEGAYNNCISKTACATPQSQLPPPPPLRLHPPPSIASIRHPPPPPLPTPPPPPQPLPPSPAATYLPPPVPPWRAPGPAGDCRRRSMLGTGLTAAYSMPASC